MVRVRETWLSTAVFLLYWRAETLWVDIWIEKKERRGRYEGSTWESRGKKKWCNQERNVELINSRMERLDEEWEWLLWQRHLRREEQHKRTTEASTFNCKTVFYRAKYRESTLQDSIGIFYVHWKNSNAKRQRGRMNLVCELYEKKNKKKKRFFFFNIILRKTMDNLWRKQRK